jgi:TatD DNase family protein
MILADSHTHLYLEEFDEDRDEMIERALAKGVEYFFLPNIDKNSISPLRSLAGRYPQNIYPMMGLHPTSVKDDWEEQLEVIEGKLREGGFVAVGEIGIDLYRDKTYMKEQVEAFRHQVRLAKELDLPIVIHSRNSFDEIFEIMDDVYEPGLRGVFHCFTGGRRHVRKILGWEGFRLGIGGVLTFKNAGLDNVITKVGLEHLVLETDSPYLSPEPYRGKRNESANVYYVAERLAEIKNISIDEVAEVTTGNTLELFSVQC